MKELITGIKGRYEEVVTYNKTAKGLADSFGIGSGTIEVYSTPSMILLMEFTASDSVFGYIEETLSTVGTRLDVEHLAATPIGMKVWCESELTEINGKKLTFSVTAYDEYGIIGKGTHERFIVNREKFISKAEAKKENIK